MAGNRDDISSEVGRVAGETFAGLAWFSPIGKPRVNTFIPDERTESEQEFQEAIESI